MEIREIRYFRTVCETGSFRKAAEKLHISQPSLSAAIQKMEEQLGVKLLSRDNRGVMLTQAGAVLFRESERLVRDEQYLERLMKDLSEDEGRSLEMAFPSTVGAWLWPMLLEEFPKKHPEIRLYIHDMSTYDILRGIEDDSLEIGYGVLDVNENTQIQMRPLIRDEMKLLVSTDSPLASKERVDICDLEGLRLAMYKKGSSLTETLILRELSKQGVSPELLYVREQSTVFNLAAQGLCAAVLLDETELIRNNTSLRVLYFRNPIEYSCGFFWKKGRCLSSSARKLLAFFH